MKKMKKILSLILSVCLIVCAVPMTNITAASWTMTEKAGYSEDVTTLKANQSSIDKLLENGKGVLWGLVPYTYNYSTNKTDRMVSWTYATDGILNEFYPYTGLYSYVTFQLDDVYKINEFGLILKNSSYRNSYEVYIGSDYDTLYTGTPVYVFDGTAEGYTSSMGQYVQFTDDETYSLPQGSLIGVKFTECMNSSGVIATANRGVRVAEIFANGTATKTDVVGMGYDPYYVRLDTMHPDNILANATLHSYTGFSSGYASNTLKYFDGEEAEAYISCTGEHPTITYALRASTEIDSFMMYQTNATLHSSYSIYVGDDADTLYTDENKIYSWDAAANTAKIQEYYFNSDRKVGRFLGIYFDDIVANSDNVGIRIGEVYVGGTEFDTEVYNSTRTEVQARISADNNLLKGRTATVGLAYVTSKDKYGYVSGKNFSYLTDGTLSTSHCDIYGYGHAYDVFVYSLGGTASVEGFELFNRSAAQNTSYEVYISDSPNGILNEENKIYSYDGSTDIEASNRCQYVHFVEPKVGAYIAVKLIQTYGANASSNNYRISEIAAYGTLTNANTYEIYSTEGVNAYTENNLLKDVLVERTGTGGGEAGWDIALTDGVVNAKSDLTNLSGDGKTYLTWDLGYTAVIDKFIVAQYPNYASGFEYYVSHDKDTLYNEENHVATYNITELFSESSENYEETVVFNEDSKPVGRYVGVRIIYLSANQERLRVYEISAIGEAAPPELIPHNYAGFATGFEDGDSVNDIGGTAYTATDDTDTNVYAGSASRVHTVGTETAEWLISDYTMSAYRTYNISFWYKADTDLNLGYVTPSSAQNGNPFGNSNGEWKQYTETVTVTQDTQLALNFYTAEESGIPADTVIYIDDISIVPVITVINDGVTGGSGTVEVTTVDDVLTATFTAEPEFAHALKHWVDLAGNIQSEDEVYTVLNPWPGLTLKPIFEEQQLAFDFEKELNLTADGAVWYTPETVGYTARYVHSGNKSMQQTVVSTAERTHTLPVDLYSGAEYEVSFKYFVQKSDLTVQAAVGLNGTATDTATLAYADEWQTYSCKVTATADTDRVTIAFGNGDAVIYIDDICVEPTSDDGKITVTVNAAENGTGTVNDSKIVLGKPVIFTAIANEGYVFDKWINANGETVSNERVYIALGISEDTALTPVFIETPEASGSYGFETAVDDSDFSDLAVRYTTTLAYYDSENVHWGESSLRLDGYGSSYTHSMTMKKDYTYKVSFWYLLPSTTTATIQLQFGDQTEEGCTTRYVWTERFLKITPTEDTQFTISAYGGESTYTGGPVYIDDIKIEAYHTVSIADTLNTLISVPTTEPADGAVIEVTAKKINSDGKYFFGWLKDGVVTEADSYVKEITVLEDLVIDENVIGTPVYTELYDTNNDTNTDIIDLIHTKKKAAVDCYVLGSDIDRSGALNADDISAIRKNLLGIVQQSERDAYLSQTKIDIVGTSDDLNTWIYQLGTDGVMVREAVFDSGKNDNNPVEIVQITDMHFNYCNDRDFEEANPTVMSTYEKRDFQKNGSSVANAEKCMEYASYFNDQTVITGDTLDYLTWGAIELVQKVIWDKDPMALVSLGNHDPMMQMQGLVAETTSLDSRYNRLAEVWRHDVYYTSRVIDEKVMVVQMDNALSHYWDGQEEKLAADIQKARENGYMILLFQHVPIMTKNSAETNLAPMRQNGDGAYNFCEKGVGANASGVTKEVYDLITSNADVIKGIFCGHFHSDYYTEVIATNNDGTDAVIPQYILTASAYDKGHVLKITVN